MALQEYWWINNNMHEDDVARHAAGTQGDSHGQQGARTHSHTRTHTDTAIFFSLNDICFSKK